MRPHKSYREIAEQTGLSGSYISRVFSGERIPRVHYAKLIANSLGMSLDDFYVDYLRDHCEKDMK